MVQTASGSGRRGDKQRPVLVCNRTGRDVLDFRGSRSVAAVDGAIAHAHASPDPAIVLVDWMPQARQLAELAHGSDGDADAAGCSRCFA